MNAALRMPERSLTSPQPGPSRPPDQTACPPGVTLGASDPAPDGQLVVRAAYPCSEAVVRRLQDAGLTVWFAEEHAAWTDQGWIDVEALEGEPMERPHR